MKSRSRDGLAAKGLLPSATQATSKSNFLYYVVNKFASEALLTFAGLHITRTVQQNKEGPHGNFVICI